MVKTSRAQRVALKRVFDRNDIVPQAEGTPMRFVNKQPMTYRNFRASIHGTIGCDGAVTVYWAGMWLCIERDGYTHS
jgi:hypothetical protein